MKGIKLTIKVDPTRVARGPLRLPRSARHGCGKHPSRAAAKQALRRDG